MSVDLVIKNGAIEPGLERKAFLAELEQRIEEATAALIAEARKDR